MSGGVTSSYVYDADGKRVKETIAGVTRVFIGNYYELDNGTVKKYYYAGATRAAESSGGVLYFLLTDHLGSTALTLDSSGVRVTELRYYPFGAARYNANNQVTTYRFTGQRWDVGTALYFYQSRWYDPLSGRFLAADTIVPNPGNPQTLNRHSYVLGNPLKYQDPTGHWVETAFDVLSLGMTINDIRTEGLTFWNAVSLVTDVASVALPIVPAGASHVIRAGKLANKTVDAADTATDALKAIHKVDNLVGATKADIVADLSTGTTQSRQIAEAMKRGDIGINILGDETFEKAYRFRGGDDSVANVDAFAYGHQTYYRQKSVNISRDAVHEGTHALDHIAGFQGTTSQWEKRAYFFERQFQLRKQRHTEFRTLPDILEHIEAAY